MFRPLGTTLVSSSASASCRFVSSTRSSTRSRARWSLCALSAATLAALALAHPAQAATTLSDGTAKTVLPGGVVVAKGLRVAVVSATVNEGDAIYAQRALVAANTALSRTRDFQPIPTSQVAEALQSLTTKGGTDLRSAAERRRMTSPDKTLGEPDPVTDTRNPLDAQDYRALGKKLKAERMLSVYLTPGDSSDASATYSAVVELYDTTNGVLVGRGEGTFTSTVDAVAAAAPAPKTEAGSPAITSRGVDAVTDGVARPAVAKPLDLATRAVGGAVFRAVQELGRPIELRGIVVSIPGPYQARVSLSEYRGLRNGARIEFLDGDTPVAYGTTFSVGAGEALVSVAPENAFSSVYVNMHVRNVNNPTIVRAGKTDRQLDEEELKGFEKEFAFDLAVAGLAYVGLRN